MASKRKPDAEPHGANAGSGAAPPSRLRLRLRTIDDVKAELARLYRSGKAGEHDVATVSKLANVLAILGRTIEGSELAARIEALEELGRRKGR